MDTRAKELLRQGDALFSDRSSLMSLWQEQADNFYVERADFTRIRSIGMDFTSHLMTSFPLMVRRDLGNAISSMLRPRGQVWLSLHSSHEEREDQQSKEWLQWAGGLQWRAMYDRAAQFVRATKEGDHDFASFGQCVISHELNRARDTLLFRCWHLRDTVWAESYDGKIGTVHRKWKPFACDLVKQFNGLPGVSLDSKLIDRANKEPYSKVECRHIILEGDRYTELSASTGKKWRTPFVSIYLDVENEAVIQEVGLYSKMYTIPRWQTVSGSQYAYSPATVAALPDARLIQAITRTLLEAGEKAVNPPMLAVRNAVRSDINIYAGGVTTVDAVFDGKLQEVLAPISQDFRGLPQGTAIQQDIREMLKAAFYLDKLVLPQQGPQMTAFQVAQLVQEYIRNALPLFEPMEDEYNGSLCEDTFNLMMRNGAFGSYADIPQPLRGQSVQFRFVSPLTQAIGADKGAKFQQTAESLRVAAELDPDAPKMVDAATALRDTLDGIGIPAKWMLSEQDFGAAKQAGQMQRQLAGAAQETAAGAHVATQVANAKTAMDASGMSEAA